MNDPKTTFVQFIDTVKNYRSNLNEFVDFLVKPDIIKQTFQLIGSDELNSEFDEEFKLLNCQYKAIRLISDLLLYNKKYYYIISRNEYFILYLHTFVFTFRRYTHPEMKAGYYQSIASAFLTKSKGRELRNRYIHSFDRIMQNLNTLAFEGLALFLFTTFPKQLISDEYGITRMISKIENDYHPNIIANFIYEVYQNTNRIFQEKINNPNIFQSFLDIGCRAYVPNENLSYKMLLLAEILLNTVKITDKYVFSVLLAQYEDQIDISSRLSNATYVALKLFPKQIDKVIPNFFADNPLPICREILKLIKNIPLKEFQRLCDSTYLFQSCIEYYPTYLDKKVNGAYFELVVYIIEAGVQPSDYIYDDWIKWANEVIVPRQIIFSSCFDEIPQEFQFYTKKDDYAKPIILPEMYTNLKEKPKWKPFGIDFSDEMEAELKTSSFELPSFSYEE